MIVLWRVTTRCNYACGFCAYDQRLGGRRVEVDEAAAWRFGRLLAGWSRARGEPVLLSWLGGEPLLWRPVWALSAGLAAAGLAISATTNASRLGSAKVRRAIVSSFAELTVSLDGPASVHDRLRGRSGAWQRVRDAVRTLAAERGAAPLRLRANAVLMRDTLAHFAPLCDDLADWGVDEITFNQLGGRDRPAFFPAQRLRPADIDAFAAAVPTLRRRLAARGVTLRGGAPYLERLRASAVGTALAVGDCRPGEAFLFVDEHGLLSPCSHSGDGYGIPITSLTTPADLDALPARFAALRRPAVCGDCPSTQVHAKFAAA